MSHDVDRLWRWRAELNGTAQRACSYRPRCNGVVAPWPRPQSTSTNSITLHAAASMGVPKWKWKLTIYGTNPNQRVLLEYFINVLRSRKWKKKMWSWDSVVSIMTRPQATQSRIQIPAAAREKAQTGSGAHKASYSEGSRAISLGVKQARHYANCSPPANAEIKSGWSYTSTPLICLHALDWVNLKTNIIFFWVHHLICWGVAYHCTRS
jgi:hypothetical protein